MKNIALFIGIASVILVSTTSNSQNINPSSYPYVILTNGKVSCSVFKPDREQGFYRSTRWEWSGIIWQLTYKGHTFFAERTTCTPHNPLDNEHGMSTAEEFGVLRYDEAKPGETFMKIGVGLLEKQVTDSRYRFNGNYRLIESGTWSTNYGETWIEFIHTLHDRYGYSYTYRKRMELLPNEPVLVISNTLENTGTCQIETDQYNHNFFSIDNILIGPDYCIDLFFKATLSTDLSPKARLRDNVIRFFDKVDKPLFTSILGFNTTPEHCHVVIRNTKTGAGVDIRGDYPLSRFLFWTDGQVVSPELFLKIDIDPGESSSWSRTYTFIAD